MEKMTNVHSVHKNKGGLLLKLLQTMKMTKWRDWRVSHVQGHFFLLSALKVCGVCARQDAWMSGIYKHQSGIKMTGVSKFGAGHMGSYANGVGRILTGF